MDFVKMSASKAVWSAYRDYVESVRSAWPQEVYDFIQAPWHYDFRHHQCPHDAWLEEIVVRENAGGERLEVRNTEIEIRLLGSFQDGYITFRYSGVRRYSLEGNLCRLSVNDLPSWHGSWQIDEVRVSPSGQVVHEIAFDSGVSLVIHCDTFRSSTTIPDRREDL
jgi:hypothetical protein